MKDAVGVAVENPDVFLKSLLKLADVIVIESIDVKLNDSNNLVVVICSCSLVRAVPTSSSPPMVLEASK